MYYIIIHPCLVKTEIVSFLSTAKHFFLQVLNTFFMYKSVQLYTYPQFENECSLCWNELKPVQYILTM